MIDIPIFKDTYKDKDGKPLVPQEPYAECPFCGQTDREGDPDTEIASIVLMESNESEIMGQEHWYVECKSCGARGPESPTPALAVEGWKREPV